MKTWWIVGLSGVLSIVLAIPSEAGQTVTVQFGNAAVITAQNNTVLQFGAQHPAGRNWETTAGQVILTLVGPADHVLSATLTLTGIDNAHPFKVIYDGPNAKNVGGDDVSIAFSGSGFDCYNKPVPGTASLDGSISLADAAIDPFVSLAKPVQLVAKANGVAFGTVMPANGDMDGPFNGVINKSTGFNLVSSISGVFSFSFDPTTNLAGDFVQLPHSADVTVYGTDAVDSPEPSTLALALASVLSTIVLREKRRRTN